MGFVYEKVPKEDEQLYDSFRIKDYYDGKLRLWNGSNTWVVDREREIYFTFVGGGVLEVPKQYTLIWNGDKIVVFLKSQVSTIKNEKGKFLYLKPCWNIIEVRAPIKLRDKAKEIIELVKEVAIVGNSEYFELQNIPSSPKFLEVVE